MNNLTRERSLRMRGAAIFMIYIHNLLHMVVSVRENEFFFLPMRAERILDSFLSFSSSFIADFFSYFGWYGVPVFMFLSGYGLVMKYEREFTDGNTGRQVHLLQTFPYLWRNFLKLFILMAPCYLIYLLGTSLPVFSKMSLAQFTMTSNLYKPSLISPGVYWYFGLTLQFYIIYLLYHRFRSETFLWVTAFLMLAVSLAVALFSDVRTNEYLRHNSPVWLPVFLVGMWYARRKTVPGLGFISKHRLATFLLLSILWLWSTVNVWLWVFSPLLVLPLFGLICIPLCERVGKPGSLTSRLSASFSRCLTYLGGISAGLFVCHPVIRVLALKAYDLGCNLLIVTLVYAVLSVLVAAVYNLCYKRVMKKLLPKQ